MNVRVNGYGQTCADTECSFFNVVFFPFSLFSSSHKTTASITSYVHIWLKSLRIWKLPGPMRSNVSLSARPKTYHPNDRPRRQAPPGSARPSPFVRLSTNKNWVTSLSSRAQAKAAPFHRSSPKKNDRPSKSLASCFCELRKEKRIYVRP